MYVPKTLWASSFSCKRLLLFKKQYEVSKRKGVVGKRGRKIPNIPNPRERKPRLIKMYFFNSFSLSLVMFFRLQR